MLERRDMSREAPTDANIISDEELTALEPLLGSLFVTGGDVHHRTKRWSILLATGGLWCGTPLPVSGRA